MKLKKISKKYKFIYNNKFKRDKKNIKFLIHMYLKKKIYKYFFIKN